MLLRSYSEKDLKEILALFYDAVHLVAAKDYSPAQLDAWAPRLPDEERWRNSLSAHYALVAEEGGKIVGFGDIDGTGYLDRLYAAADFQRRVLFSIYPLYHNIVTIIYRQHKVTWHTIY